MNSGLIGVDVGTSTCAIAYIDPSGNPTIISNSRGEQFTRSAIYKPENGEMLIGTDAVEQAFLDPESFISTFKPMLGSTDSLLKHTHTTPTDAAAILINQLKEDAERHLGIEVNEVLGTCPANFRDDQKQALKEAYKLSGIKLVQLIPEPTAAAYAYVLAKECDSGVFAVYDFGGGTFDVSIVKVEGSQMTVLSTEGVPKLGGNDISAKLQTIVLNEVERVCGVLPTADSEPLFFLDLAQRIEAAKASLGKQREVPIVVSFQGQQVIKKVTQEEFHSEIAPLVDESIEAFDKAVTGAGLNIEQIDFLIMAGGASRSPYIQDRIADHTGLVPQINIDPQKVVAYGAALACVAEISRQGRTATLHGQAIPAPETFFRDVTAHCVGCAVITTNNGGKKHLVNSSVVPKNTPIPCRKTSHFYLEKDDQTEVRVEILQGEAEADRDACLLIGELTLDNLPREAKRTERIQVEYLIDSDGMVTATATDKISEKHQTVSVDYKKGVVQTGKPRKV